MDDGKVALLERQYFFTGFWTNFTIDFELKKNKIKISLRVGQGLGLKF